MLSGRRLEMLAGDPMHSGKGRRLDSECTYVLFLMIRVLLGGIVQMAELKIM